MPTPETSGESFEREVLEPILVLRPRRTDALADLFRELTELSVDDDPPGQEKTRAYEAVDLSKEPKTQRVPPLPPLPPRRRTAPPPPPATGKGVRRAAGVIALCAAVLVLALVLYWLWLR